jgi:ABC-2 type transport system permease protein
VNAPFLFVTACSLKNRVRRRLGRLREPRYLAGMIAGLAYLYWFVFRNQMRASSRAASGILQLGPYVPDLVAGAALLLWVWVVLVWLWPFPAQPWTFTGAEVHFFFTAPVSRRRLLSYKLLRSQTGIVFTVLMVAFFSGGMRAAAAGRWSFVLGGWLFFTILQLHVRGATLTKLSLRAPMGRIPVLAWTSIGAMVVLSGLLLVSFGTQARRVAGLSASEAMRALLEIAKTPPVAALLTPFAATVRPIFAFGPGAFLAALWPALAALALHYWWVLGSDANLEEAAAATERRRSRQKAVPPPSSLRVPFTLAERGRPEAVVLWKNTILLGRYASIGLLLRVLIPMVVLALVLGLRGRGSRLAPLLAMLVSFTTLVGPFMVRNDLRHDMPRLPVLKTWPLSGRQLLTGEVLAPTAVLSVLVWCLLVMALALSPPSAYGPTDLLGRLALAGGVAVLAPVLIAGQVLIQNAAVVLFPGWIATGGARARGIEAMGQNMLMFAGTLLALALGVLPAAAVAGGLAFLLYQVAGWLAAFPAAVLVAAILGVETAFLLGWLGRVLERTDPAQVETAE